MRGARSAALPFVLVLAAACGYRVVTPYRARGGVERIYVRAFENDSADPELGGVVTGALRDELARRGAAAGPEAPGQLQGTVRVVSGVPSSFSATSSRVAVEIRARLTKEGKLVRELVLQRGDNHLGGADPLEVEGRRATALHKLARDAARELLRELEEDDRQPGAAKG
ncbi:MAG TPA: LPS assembly lipoprotein LptE [Anaeromyxobacter sp.]|nr:LPS assembly lipoprotein LptE [Anaeromyxobacter sp.]